MRIADNHLNLYGLDNRQDKLKPLSGSASAGQRGEVPRLPAPVAQVESVSRAQKQQLLQNYLQQPQSKNGDLAYPQQRAVSAYGQLAQQDERDKLRSLLGVDEYA